MSGFVLTTPEQMEMWVFLSRRSQLSLEVGTGMKASRGSVLNDVKARGWTNKGTKHGALLDMLSMSRAMDPAYVPHEDTIVKSLVSKLGEEKATKAIAKALRDGDKMRVQAGM